LRSETHANFSEEIEVEDASVVRKSYRLKPAFGKLVVFTDIPDAKVSVGGQEVPLRDGRGEVRLPGGDYEVVVSWGQWQLRRKVVVLKERTVEEYFRARDCMGHLTILSDEPIKGLTVNGVKMDLEVPLTLKNLPVGEYVVRSLREVGEIWEIWEGSARVTAGRTEILRLTKRTMKKFFLKHGAPIRSVVFSPDGKFLASGSRDRTVKVWEVGSWWEVATLRGHGGVLSVTFSPDGRFLASGYEYGTVKVWEVGSWREYGAVKVWDVGSWREVATLRGHGGVLSFTFSPDGRFLASGYEYGTVKVWEVGSWREVATLRGHGSNVLSVTFSPDGKFLASGSEDGTIGIWATEILLSQ
jgi:WD40 repeat protein